MRKFETVIIAAITSGIYAPEISNARANNHKNSKTITIGQSTETSYSREPPFEEHHQ
jgi:hypothetical protein